MEVFKEESIYSPSMKRQIKYAIALPAAYGSNPDERFPVIYALHGRGASFEAWVSMESLLDKIDKFPTIIVSFDADEASMYIDSPVKPASQFNTFVGKAFIPFIDAAYRTKAKKAYRAITGFSMGGFGAFSYFLNYPELFSSVSSLSGAFHVFNNKVNEWIENVAGPYNKEVYDSYYLYPRIEKFLTEEENFCPLYIHCGTEDSLIEENRKFHTFLEQKKIEHTYLESNGEHNWDFWNIASGGVLNFHWKNFG